MCFCLPFSFNWKGKFLSKCALFHINIIHDAKLIRNQQNLTWEAIWVILVNPFSAKVDFCRHLEEWSLNHLWRHQFTRQSSFQISNWHSGCQDLKLTHNILTNYIILESKFFLYRCKLNKTPSSILHLTEKIKNTYYIERSIARAKNKIGLHY